MWFSLILVGLFIGVSVRQSTQGLFNAFVMATFSVCCAVLAFGVYEWLAIKWVAPYFMPSYAMPIALAVLYGVPFAILHLVFRLLVKRPSRLPSLPDRIGAGACGLVTGMVTVGMLAVCLQMVPFHQGSILGYARVKMVDSSDPAATPPDTSEGDNELFLRPDRFVISLASVLSHGVFSGSSSFYDHNPDLMQAIGWAGAAPSVVSRYAPPNSIQVEGSAPVQFVYKMSPADERRNVPVSFEPEQASGGNEFRMVRVRLMQQARDANRSHLFTLRQFRLVGKRRGEDLFEQFHPIAIEQAEGGGLTTRHIRTAKVMSSGQYQPVTDWPLTPSNGDRLEIVFELPVGFEPSFLEYKRAARDEVTFAAPPPPAATPERTTAAPAAQPQPAQTASAEPTTGSGDNAQAPARPGRRRSTRGSSGTSGRSRRSRGGRARAVAVNEGGSRFSDDMPLALRTYRQNNAQVTNGRLVSGHLIAETAQQEQGSDAEVTKFFVPEDKRLLQLNTVRLQARSSLGRAVSNAVTTLQAYYVEDTNGNRYQLVGKYATATVNGTEVFEVQYFSGPVGSIGGLGQFNRIDEEQLTPEDPFSLLFLVDPGVQITAFSTGGDATRRDDLTTENLVAPQ